MQCGNAINLFQCHRQLQMLGALHRQISVKSALQVQSANNLVKKFLINNNQAKKSRKWHQSRPLPNPSDLAQHQMRGEKNSHRRHVLNKVFMDKICDILSTGRISSLFTGYGLEISKVQVPPDMVSINVHWFCTGLDLDNKLDEILHANAYLLRHELSQQRVIGRVPPINFVKDRRYYKVMDVEKLLALADFGEDFEPTDPTHHVKCDIIMKTEFDDKIKSSLEIPEDGGPDVFLQALTLSSSQSSDIEDPTFDLPLDVPALRDNILGVDTHKIFTMVRQSMTRTRAEHRKSLEESTLFTATIHHTQKGSFPSLTSRTEDIRQWASTYKELRRKERQTKKEGATQLTLPRTYVEDDVEEIVYEEEEDFFDENFELDTPEKS